MDAKLSIVIPAYNEAENLDLVVPAAADVLERLGASYEILVVDDGSRDATADTVRRLAEDNGALRLLRLRRNEGKSAALAAGLSHATGDVVVLMDADGQDDPREIPALLDALESSLDLVTGRRASRNDRFVKRATSRLYNTSTSKVTGVDGRDFNSGLKAMRAKVANELDLYGELHRYIPVLAHWAGFRVGEIDVVHHPRLYGRSKYGIARFWRGMLDLLTVRFLISYRRRPLHLFGGIGVVIGAAGLAVLIWMTTLHLTGHAIGRRPALIAGVLMVTVAVQLFSVGLLGELMVYLGRRGDRSPPVEVD